MTLSASGTQCSPQKGNVMNLKKRIAAIVTAASLAFGGIAVTSSAAEAQSDKPRCRTVSLSDNNRLGHFAIRPRMSLPVCYDGSNIWQNGTETARVNTYGYNLNGVSWSGTYNNTGGSWIGAGINYEASLPTGWATFSCASRWTVDANGKVSSFERGC